MTLVFVDLSWVLRRSPGTQLKLADVGSKYHSAEFVMIDTLEISCFYLFFRFRRLLTANAAELQPVLCAAACRHVQSCRDTPTAK